MYLNLRRLKWISFFSITHNWLFLYLWHRSYFISKHFIWTLKPNLLMFLLFLLSLCLLSWWKWLIPPRCFWCIQNVLFPYISLCLKHLDIRICIELTKIKFERVAFFSLQNGFNNFFFFCKFRIWFKRDIINTQASFRLKDLIISWISQIFKFVKIILSWNPCSIKSLYWFISWITMLTVILFFLLNICWTNERMTLIELIDKKVRG